MPTFKLTPEQARSKWIEALRSGKYSKTTGRLTNSNRYCCLGVACEVFIEEESPENNLSRVNGFYDPTDDILYTTKLPFRVVKWLGLRERYCNTVNPLASRNDTPNSTFAMIADFIESEAFKDELADDSQ